MLIQFFIGLMALLAPSATPLTCDCPLPDIPENISEAQRDSLVIKQAFEAADLVFFARVTGFTSDDPGWDEADLEDSWHIGEERRFGVAPRLQLIKAYKGPKKIFRQKELQISQRWRLCDMYFNRAESYVFFGTLTNDGRIRTSICAPNRLIRFEKHLKAVEAWMN